MINLIFSIKAAQRLTQRGIRECRVFWNAVLVIFKKGSPRFMSKRDFLNHFAETRRQKAKNHSVEFHNEHFAVTTNQGNGSHHQVEIKGDHLICDCEDFYYQSKSGIKKPTCQHCYAVLNELGYSRLSDYVNARAEEEKDEALLNKESSEAILKSLPEWNKELSKYDCQLLKHSFDVFGRIKLRLYDGGLVVAEMLASNSSVKATVRSPRKYETRGFNPLTVARDIALTYKKNKDQEEVQMADFRESLLGEFA